MKAIYTFFWDCGRMGSVEGLFVANKDDIENALGKPIYFGEILGKHSEIFGDLKKEDLTIKSEDQNFIKEFERILGEGFSTGYNPLDYLPEEEPDDEDEDEDDEESE